MTMRKASLLFALITVIAVMQGCIVPSVHPLYRSDDDIIFDEGLIGRWKPADNGEIWEFSPLKDKNTANTLYLVTITDDNEPAGILVGALVEIGGLQFMDLSPYDFEFTANKEKDDSAASTQIPGITLNTGKNGSVRSPGLWFNNLLLFPTHTILQVRRTGDTMKLALIEYDWVTKQSQNGTFELAHEVEDNLVLITASSDALRSFARRYADDESVFNFEDFVREQANR
jgi:hypothetical protein